MSQEHSPGAAARAHSQTQLGGEESGCCGHALPPGEADRLCAGESSTSYG